MNIFTKIKKFLTPYKWETIWTGEANGYLTLNGERVRSTPLICVVKYDRYKDTYISYMTNGNLEKEIDINWLAAQCPSLREVLQKNGIRI
mgnify:CR=1 FL=1